MFHFTIQPVNALQQYSGWIVGAAPPVDTLTWAMFYFVVLSRRLRSSEQRLRDLTRRLEQSNRNLQHFSAADGLTGVANRRAFDETLVHEWARSGRTGQSLALVLVDFDLFRKHNDSYGHLAGDECLKRVVDTIRQCARRPVDLAARYGGEEFVALLPGVDLNGAALVAERMRAGVAATKLPHVNNLVGLRITISAGVAAMVPTSTLSAHTLVTDADEALNRAKAVGRNQLVLATD
jgi:diguanylate cyclase (GGDEF)-like protein